MAIGDPETFEEAAQREAPDAGDGEGEEPVEDAPPRAAEASETDPPEGGVQAGDDDAWADAEEALAEELGAPAEPPAEGDAGEGDAAADDETAVDPVRAVAALLFASPDPLSVGRLKDLLGGATPSEVQGALDTLGARLAEAGLPIVLREIAGGWRLVTDPEVADVVARLDRSRKVERISQAALETLSIVAYRQPVTKAEIEAIRGVQAGPLLRTLVDRGLVRVAGRADQPGAPLLYGTTQEFLDRFGLARIGDLPRDAELARD